MENYGVRLEGWQCQFIFGKYPSEFNSLIILLLILNLDQDIKSITLIIVNSINSDDRKPASASKKSYIFISNRYYFPFVAPNHPSTCSNSIISSYFLPNLLLIYLCLLHRCLLRAHQPLMLCLWPEDVCFALREWGLSVSCPKYSHFSLAQKLVNVNWRLSDQLANGYCMWLIPSFRCLCCRALYC